MAERFGAIGSNISIGAGQSVRRNSADNDFEAYTPASASVTTKGDIQGYSTSPARIPVGTDGQVLSADSTQALGVKWQNAGTNSIISNETPSGLVNGSNVTYTLVNSPIVGTLKLYLNGQRQTYTTDYTLSGSTITMVVAPVTGDIIRADYELAGATTGNADTLDGANLSTDGTLASNSDGLIPSQKAVKTYSDTKAPTANPSFTGTVSVAGAITQSGTADHITLTPGTNKLVKISVLRQDNTTNTYSNSSVVLTGWGFFVGDGASSYTKTISFGITFSGSEPIVLASLLGKKAGVLPTLPSTVSEFDPGMELYR